MCKLFRIRPSIYSHWSTIDLFSTGYSGEELRWKSPNFRITGRLWGESIGDHSSVDSPHKGSVMRKAIPYHDYVFSFISISSDHHVSEFKGRQSNLSIRWKANQPRRRCGAYCRVPVYHSPRQHTGHHYGSIIQWRWVKCLRPLLHVTVTTWWRHQMETFSALLALCAGNSPVDSPHKGK